MDSFTGTWRLIRLALRRDRIKIPVSVLGLLAMSGLSAPALVDAYPDAQTQLAYIAGSAPSVVGRLFQGTVQGVNLGSIVMAEIFLFTSVILAVMSIFMITRHTRHNEEIGAGELIGSAIVGKSAPLTAALIVTIGFNLIFGILLFAALAGIPELEKTGSFYFAASISMVGIFFAGVAAITSQLSDYRRGANGMAIGALIGFFLIRGFGDALGDLSADGLTVTASWLSWLSPIGWGYQVLPFTANRPSPMLLLLAVFIVCLVIGYALLRRRDLGSSIFESRAGLARAKANLLSAGGLARRLQIGSLLAWSAGFLITGVMIGVLANDFRETFEENELFQDFLALSGGDNFVKSMVSSMMPIFAAMLSGFTVTAMAKMIDEETSGRLEFLLSSAQTRLKWLMSHISFISLGLVLALLLLGISGGFSYVLTAEVLEISFMEIVWSALANLPAMLLFMAVILFVYAAIGRFVRTFAWFYYIYVALIGSLASIWSWPQWASNFSPFVHTPSVPSCHIEWLPLLAMTGLAAGLVAVSVWLLNRRDIALK
ncbi:MAG: hypothetical protein R3313_01770 [Candidatus Saccharimonadales bacterium]|nr:hypothetical protein [Candidatus Saccharimonadales bacterium]